MTCREDKTKGLPTGIVFSITIPFPKDLIKLYSFIMSFLKTQYLLNIIILKYNNIAVDWLFFLSFLEPVDRFH